MKLAAIAASSTSAERTHKIEKAAREFESVLLNTVLGPLERTFSSLPGKDNDVESDNYQSMGMQALSSALTAKGGLGIANLIAAMAPSRSTSTGSNHQSKGSFW